MRIGKREIGPGHPALIVAEGGTNHAGSLDLALRLTDAAAAVGADAIKWQLWIPEKMYPGGTPEIESARRWRMPREWIPMLRDRAHDRDMLFGCSAFDLESLDYVDQFVDFHKVASLEATWTPYLRAVGRTDKPTMVSLGGMGHAAPDWDRIEHAIRQLIVLQCTISYPAELKDCDLRVLVPGECHGQDCGSALACRFRFVGYSDHTLNPTIAPCAAVALGACVIEKHIRFRRTRKGEPPDWNHSVDPEDFATMVKAIRLTEQALGSSEKRLLGCERPYLKYRRGPKGLRGA